MEIEHLFDFPSHGDTAFPALVRISKDTYWFYNYSSSLEDESLDFSWFRGQISLTKIYRQEITFRKK